MQMMSQLGPIPGGLLGQSKAPSQAFSLTHHGPVAQKSYGTDQSTHHDQSQRGRAAIQGQPTQRPAPGRTLHLGTGQLEMMHETACPLQMELAKVDPAMSSLVMAMLQYHPQKRVSAAEALSHPFLSELSPALRLLRVRAESKAKRPHGRSQGSAASGDHNTAQQALLVESLSNQKADKEPSSRQPGLPTKPEPRRQPGVNMPTRSNPSAHAPVPSWLLGTLPMPMPSDPLLRPTEPQLQSPQGASQPQLGPTPAKPQPQSTGGCLACDVVAQSSTPASPEPAAADVAVSNALVATGAQGKGLERLLSPDKLTAAEAAAQVLRAQQAETLPATLSHSPPATAVACRAVLDGSAAAAVGNTVPREEDHGQAAAAADVSYPLPATGQGQGGGQMMAKLESDKLPAGEAAPRSGLVKTPSALAQGSLTTPGVAKAWNGVAHLLQQMTPVSQVLL